MNTRRENYLELFVDQREKNAEDCWKFSSSVLLVHPWLSMTLTKSFEYVIEVQKDHEFDLLILDWLKQAMIVVVHHLSAMFYTREKKQHQGEKVFFLSSRSSSHRNRFEGEFEKV